MNPSPLASLIKASDLFSQALSFYSRYVMAILGILIVPALLNAMGNLFGPEKNIALVLLFSLVIAVVGFLSAIAFIILLTEKGNPTGGVKGAYQRALPLFFPFLWISILQGVIVLSGFLLLIIPGILLTLWLSFADVILVAENQRGMAALARSWHYTQGLLLPIFWRFLFIGIIGLLTALVLGIITSMIPSPAENIIFSLFQDLVVIPLFTIYLYGLYVGVRNLKAAPTAEEEAAKIKQLNLFTIGGIIIIILGFIFLFSLIVSYFPWDGGSIPPGGASIPAASTQAAFLLGNIFSALF